MIDDLVSKVFASRDAAHREHWRTTSYAQHMALDAFYNDVIDAVDELVECYQGQFGLIEPFGVTLPAKPIEIVTQLRDDVDWMQAVREDITKGDPVLANLLDAVTAVYLKALYKLEHLT